jgi:hypothetical protein
MSTVIRVTDKRELEARRRRLLHLAGMDWAELQRRAESFMLSDRERDYYETIRSIDYLLDDDSDG